MRITILTLGTRGDVQPSIALGIGLRQIGHQVKIATHAIFRELITQYSLEFAPLTLNTQNLLQHTHQPERPRLSTLYKLAQQHLQQFLKEAWQTTQQTELLIFNKWGRLAGLHIMEKLGVPALLTAAEPKQMRFIYPQTNTYDHTLQPVYSKLKETARWHLIYKPLINRWRQSDLNLPAAPCYGVDHRLPQQKIPTIYTYSPSIFPKPDNWPPWLHVTGFCFLDNAPSWQPSPSLLSFLQAGNPPICVTFSSMGKQKEMGERVNTVLDSLRRTQQRAIIIKGWGTPSETTVPSSPKLLFCDPVPHNWLFPQLSAVIHHGGAGTTSTALRHGLPSIIIPFAYDQPLWARRVAELGAAHPPLSWQTLTSAKLAHAIHTVQNTSTMKNCAQQLASKIRTENGIFQAIKIIQTSI